MKMLMMCCHLFRVTPLTSSTRTCFLCSTSNAISVKSEYDSFTFHQQLLKDFQSQLHSFMAQGLPESSRLICFQFSPITKIFDRSVPGLHTKIWFYQRKTINQTRTICACTLWSENLYAASWNQPQRLSLTLKRCIINGLHLLISHISLI